MKNKWIIIAIIVAALIVSYPFVYKSKNAEVIINNKTISVEVARTPKELTKGLSNRDYLAPDHGMLFVFPKADIYPFWMKETRIPLDIIWLAPSEVEGMSKIVDMATLQPQTGDNIPQYTPKSPANYVLELNAGFTSSNNIKIGDEIKIK